MIHADPAQAHVLLFVNDLWNVANFRLRLVERLEAEGYRITLVAPPSPALAAQLRTPKREVLSLPMNKGGLAPLGEAALLLRLVGLVRKVRPDVLLSFKPKPNIYGALAGRFSGVPAAPNVSGLGTAFIRGGFLQHLVSFLYRRAFRSSPRVFFQNPDDLQLFVEHGLVRPEQAFLLPGSGVDLDHFRPAPPRQPDGETRLLFVGRLLRDKGVREFVEAADLVRRNHPEVRFQLLGRVGADNRTAIPQGELEAWIAAGSVEYLGELGDVRPALAQADAVVLPSYREGLSRSLLEASAMARPLIATDVPGNRSLVSDGENGILCNARSGASLAVAVERFLELTPEQRGSMGERAREKVVQGFSEQKVIGAYIELLDQLTRTGMR